MQPRLTPEIMQALLQRRMGGVGGGSAMPAQQQVTAPNNLGGPVGSLQTALPTSPQAVPAGSIPLSSPSSGGGLPQAMAAMQQGGQSQQPSTPTASAPQTANVDQGTKDMTKALMTRLLRFL